MRELGTEGIYYGGYGYATFHFATAFKAIDWDPPRVMGTAFMFYSNSNAWAEGLEGWHGVDQLGEDGANANYNAMIERFEARFGRKTAQRGRRAGLRHRPGGHPRDRQRRHPRPRSTSRRAWRRSGGCPPPTAAPACYVQFGPYDHKGYKGDFLTIRELRGGELRFDGYHRPEWPSNAES